MGCGCGRNKAVKSQGELHRGAGGYLSLKFGDEGKAYGGEHSSDTVLIVGRLTQQEKLFLGSQLAEASAYARDVRRTIISQPASLLPAAAVEGLLSANDLNGSTPVSVEQEGDEKEALHLVEEPGDLVVVESGPATHVPAKDVLGQF